MRETRFLTPDDFDAAMGSAEGDVVCLDALAGLLARHPVYMPRADHF